MNTTTTPAPVTRPWTEIPRKTLDAIRSLELPAPAQAVLAFLQTVRRENASMDEMTELVRRDPALAARILTVANSAAFHVGGELRGLKQCLQMLGIRTLHSLAASIAVHQVFAVLPGMRPCELGGFWRHSIVVAELAQSIAQQTGLVQPEEAYLCGLLHDVGELLMLGGLGADYGQLLLAADGDEVPLVRGERAAMQTDHAVVGAWLIERWRLPSFMADAVLLHHRAADVAATADPLTRVLWTAHATEEALRGRQVAEDALDVAAHLVGLAPQRLVEMHARAQAQMALLAGVLGVQGTSAPGVLPVWRPPVAPAQAQMPREQLLDVVSAMAALQPLQVDLSAAESEPQLLDSARLPARILFGVDDVVFLLGSSSHDMLVALPLPGQPPQIRNLQVELRPTATGVCSRAAQTRRVSSAIRVDAETPESVVDLQLTRALGCSGLVGVPMGSGGSLLGVMVLPVGRRQLERLEQRSLLLSSFAELLSDHLQAWRQRREQDLERQAATTERLRLRERQTVHEVSNPLGTIKNYIALARRKLPDGVSIGEELDLVQDEIERVSRMIRQLGEPVPEPAPGSLGSLDVNTAIESFSALYGQTLFGRAGVELVLDLQSPLALARVDRDSLRQILLNLWKNAAEALRPGSRVVTSTSDHLFKDGQFYVQLCVGDDGPGLPEDVRSTLFQPLGAARRSGHAGLGLSIVRGLVDRLGGHIVCQSQALRGTRFFVLLPQAAEMGMATVERPAT